jgi:hypothetical protein
VISGARSGRRGDHGGGAYSGAEVLVDTAGALSERYAQSGVSPSLLVLDECHHINAAVYLQLLKMQRANNRPFLGLTATLDMEVAPMFEQVTLHTPVIFVEDFESKAAEPVMNWRSIGEAATPEWVLMVQSVVTGATFKELVAEERDVLARAVRAAASVQQMVGDGEAAQLLLTMLREYEQRVAALAEEMGANAAELAHIRSKEGVLIREIVTGALQFMREARHALSPCMAELINLLHESKEDRIIVFCVTKASARSVARVLREQGAWQRWGLCLEVVGGQGMRAATRRAVDSFRNGETKVLCATTVLEEGIDIPHCSLVIRIDSGYNLTGLLQSRGRVRFKASAAHARGHGEARFFALGTKAQFKEFQKLLVGYSKAKKQCIELSESKTATHFDDIVKREVPRLHEHIVLGGTAGTFLHHIMLSSPPARVEGTSSLTVHGLSFLPPPPLLSTESEVESAKRIPDGCILCARVLGLVVEQELRMAGGVFDVPLGRAPSDGTPYGCSVTVRVTPYRPTVTCEVIAEALNCLPSGSLLELGWAPVESFEEDRAEQEAGEVRKGPYSIFRDKQLESFPTCKVRGGSLGLLPSMDQGFLEVVPLPFCPQIRVDVRRGMLELEHGKLSKEAATEARCFEQEEEDVEEEPGITITTQHFLRVSLADLVLPVIVDGPVLYQFLRHAPEYYEGEADNLGGYTRPQRQAPPRSLGLGLALVLRVDLGSPAVPYATILPALASYGVRVLFAHIPCHVTDPCYLDNHGHNDLGEESAAILESARRLGGWILAPPRAEESEGGHIDADFFRFMCIFGDAPYFAGTSALLSPEVWECFRQAPLSYQAHSVDVIKALLHRYSFVPATVLVETLREVTMMGKLHAIDAAQVDDGIPAPDLRVYVSLSGAYCSEGPALGDRRGIELWKEIVRQDNRAQGTRHSSTAVQLLVRDEHREPLLLGEAVHSPLHTPQQILILLYGRCLSRR